MDMMNLVTVSILCPYLFWMFKSTSGANPIMTKATIDVGNIISIIIPESPDSNINIDQLTSDFRWQLERLRKQSHVNKLENGLVTLKNILPEMLREEKKKILPLLHRALSNSKKTNAIHQSVLKDMNSRNMQRRNNPLHSRRDFLNWINLRKYNILTTTKRPLWPMKNTNKNIRKNFKFNADRNSWNKMNDNNNFYKFPRESNLMKYTDNFKCDKTNGGICTKKLPNEFQRSIPINNNRHDNDQEQPLHVKLSRSNDFFNSLNNFNAMENNVTANDCASVILIDIDGQIYSICNNTKLMNIPRNSKDDPVLSNAPSNPETSTSSNVRNEGEMVLPINIEVDDFKSVQKIIENPQLALEQINSSGFSIDNFGLNTNGNMLKRSNSRQVNDNPANTAVFTSIVQNTTQFNIDDNNDRENKSFLEFNEKNRDFTNNNNGNNKRYELILNDLGYKHHELRNTPKVTDESNYDNENFEIRIQRSIDNNFQLTKLTNTQFHELSTDSDNNRVKPVSNEQTDLSSYLKQIKNLR